MSFTCKEPKLRFPEFNGEWVEKKLGEIANIKTGNKDTQNKVQNGKYPFFVRSDTIERINSYSFDGEAILTAGDGVGVGKVFHYLNEKFDYHQRVYNIHNFKNDTMGKYVYFYFADKFYKRVIKLSAKNSVDSVRMDMITNMIIPLPSKPEQEKIASFLTTVDAKIEQLTCKKKLLEKYKKSVMQKLFSQELRFTCNDESRQAKDNCLSLVGSEPKAMCKSTADGKSEYPEWEEKQLGELFHLLRGSALSKSDIDENGIYKCIHYGELFTTYKEKISHIQSCTNLSEGQFSVIGDILMPSSDVTPQGLATASAIFENNVIIGGDTNILRPKKAINSLFVSYFLNSNKNEIMKAVTGTTVKHIYNKDVAKLIINLPSLPEQTKIANFLSAIDEKLLHVKAQTLQAQQFKKALLQQMFV